MTEEVVYFCADCQEEFDLEILRGCVRCPGCLGWDVYPVEDEEGEEIGLSA